MCFGHPLSHELRPCPPTGGDERHDVHYRCEIREVGLLVPEPLTVKNPKYTGISDSNIQVTMDPSSDLHLLRYITLGRPFEGVLFSYGQDYLYGELQ